MTEPVTTMFAEPLPERVPNMALPTIAPLAGPPLMEPVRARASFRKKQKKFLFTQNERFHNDR